MVDPHDPKAYGSDSPALFSILHYFELLRSSDSPMTTSPPPKRFLPEPVETTIRTSKRPNSSAHTSKAASPGSDDSSPDQSTMAAVQQPRRFRAEPIEETTRSSRKPKPQQQVEHVEHGLLGQKPSVDPTEPGHVTTQSPEKKPRRFAPEPVETSARTSKKKFTPEPVETSTRSSKDEEGRTQNKSRRFAPQPVETGTRTRKAGQNDDEQKSSTKPRRKFAPEPISTETTSRRRTPRAKGDASEDSPKQPQSRGSADSAHSAGGTRRFSPELIETAKGTYRRSAVNSPASSVGTATPPKDDEDEEESDDEVGSLSESRFSAAALAKRHHEEQRRHSFAVPDLPIIESDSGDDSSAPSLTNSRSSAESDQNRRQSRHPADASYTDYVLRLANQTTSDQDLIDRAMAAYINEVPHQAPAHYGFDDDDEAHGRGGKFSGENGADIRTFRRQSQDDLDWELQAMQRHHAQLEEAKRQLKHDTAGPSRFSAAALATRHKLEAEKESKSKKVKAEESELAKMRAAASPPMLGDDLVFPQTISPKMTRCETDQHPRPRTDDSDDEEEVGQQALWSTVVKVEPSPPKSGGLWGGFCNESSLPGTPRRTGLQTPAAEKENPFETATPGRKTPGSKTPRRRIYGMNLMPLTPQRTNEEDSFTSSVDKKLQLERQIEEEFPDRVITQIYNYLSIGYPSLAWGFDEELSKISRISLEELRKDDDRVNAKGYVDAPEGDGSRGEDVTNGGCRRWEALRLYVREWARQSPNFAAEGDFGGVGMGRGAVGWGGNVALRKGSWGQ